MKNHIYQEIWWTTHHDQGNPGDFCLNIKQLFILHLFNYSCPRLLTILGYNFTYGLLLKAAYNESRWRKEKLPWIACLQNCGWSWRGEKIFRLVTASDRRLLLVTDRRLLLVTNRRLLLVTNQRSLQATDFRFKILHTVCTVHRGNLVTNSGACSPMANIHTAWVSTAMLWNLYIAQISVKPVS